MIHLSLFFLCEERGIEIMKKTMVNVPFEDRKLSAAKIYMEQKGMSFEDEMSKAADALYGKYVPANVREFLELSADSKPKEQKPTSSAVGGDSDCRNYEEQEMK